MNKHLNLIPFVKIKFKRASSGCNNNRKGPEAQLQIKASPCSPILTENWPHPMDNIFPANLQRPRNQVKDLFIKIATFSQLLSISA